jgi:hypothetical protein
MPKWWPFRISTATRKSNSITITHKTSLGIKDYLALFGNLHLFVAGMVAAAPGFVRSPAYRTSPAMPAGDVAIVLVGCVAIIVFGIITMLIWSRTGGRR